jgi:hypothetical protein
LEKSLPLRTFNVLEVAFVTSQRRMSEGEDHEPEANPWPWGRSLRPCFIRGARCARDAGRSACAGALRQPQRTR